ncbi:unnamed protein product, partial [Laminaria digitata]
EEVDQRNRIWRSGLEQGLRHGNASSRTQSRCALRCPPATHEELHGVPGGFEEVEPVPGCRES